MSLLIELIFNRARELGVRDYILIISSNTLKVIGWRIRGLKSANDNEAKS